VPASTRVAILPADQRGIGLAAGEPLGIVVGDPGA
jgi:hypothetical protein